MKNIYFEGLKIVPDKKDGKEYCLWPWDAYVPIWRIDQFYHIRKASKRGTLIVSGYSIRFPYIRFTGSEWITSQS